MLAEVRDDPTVKQLLDRFPGAEIVSVRDRAVEEPDPALADPLPGPVPPPDELPAFDDDFPRDED